MSTDQIIESSTINLLSNYTQIRQTYSKDFEVDKERQMVMMRKITKKMNQMTDFLQEEAAEIRNAQHIFKQYVVQAERASEAFEHPQGQPLGYFRTPRRGQHQVNW